MSRFKGTWVVVALFGALLAFLLIAKPKTREQAKEDALTLAKADREKLERVEIANANGTFVFEKKDDAWRITAPKDVPLDESALTFVKNALELVASDAVWSSPTAEEKARAGLEKPAATVRWKAGEESGTLELGKELPPKRETVYVASSAKPGVFTAKKYDVEIFLKGLPDFRRKKLLDLERDKVRTVLLEAPGREPMMLTRADAIAPWKVTTPFRGRADRGKANGMLTRLGNVRAEEFVDAPARESGLDGLRGTITLTADGGRMWTVLVGAEKKVGEKKLVELRDGERGQVILAEAELARDVVDPFVLWRDRQLFDFFVDDVTELSLPLEKTLSLVRNADRMFTTTGGTPVIVNEEATALLRSVRDSHVVDFGAEAPAGSPKSKELGLESPVVVLRFSAQGEPFELTVGGVRPGSALRWVRTNESDTALAVDADPIARAAAALAAAATPSPPPSPAPSPTSAATN